MEYPQEGGTKPLKPLIESPRRGQTDSLDQRLAPGVLDQLNEMYGSGMPEVVKCVINPQLTHKVKKFGSAELGYNGAIGSNVGGTILGGHRELLEVPTNGRNHVNEDSAAALILPDFGLTILVDGAGGHDSGEVASLVALDTALQLVERTRTQYSPLEISLKIQESFNALEGAIAFAALHSIEREFISEFPDQTESVAVNSPQGNEIFPVEFDGEQQRFYTTRLIKGSKAHEHLVDIGYRGFHFHKDGKYPENVGEETLPYLQTAVAGLHRLGYNDILREIDAMLSYAEIVQSNAYVNYEDSAWSEAEVAVAARSSLNKVRIDPYQREAVMKGLFALITETEDIQTNCDAEKLFEVNAGILAQSNGRLCDGDRNFSIFEKAHSMRAAGSICIIDGNNLEIGQVGDTRVYRLGEDLKQLTNDDSEGGRLISLYNADPRSAELASIVQTLIEGRASRPEQESFELFLGHYFRQNIMEQRKDLNFAAFREMVRSGSAGTLIDYPALVGITSTSKGNIIRSAFGGKNIGAKQGEVGVASSFHQFNEGEVILMCSDGLTDFVGDGFLKRVLRIVQSGELSPEEAVSELLFEARLNDGNDNITALILYKSVPLP